MARLDRDHQGHFKLEIPRSAPDDLKKILRSLRYHTRKLRQCIRYARKMGGKDTEEVILKILATRGLTPDLDQILKD